MYKTGLGILAVCVSLTATANAFMEVESLAALPMAIQQNLGVGNPGRDGVADKGKPFNATDGVDSSLPMRRLLIAACEGTLQCLIALEQGGRRYSVQAYHFSGDGDLLGQWTLPGRPTTLRSLQAQISEVEFRK